MGSADTSPGSETLVAAGVRSCERRPLVATPHEAHDQQEEDRADDGPDQPAGLQGPIFGVEAEQDGTEEPAEQ